MSDPNCSTHRCKLCPSLTLGLSLSTNDFQPFDERLSVFRPPFVVVLNLSPGTRHSGREPRWVIRYECPVGCLGYTRHHRSQTEFVCFSTNLGFPSSPSSKTDSQSGKRVVPTPIVTSLFFSGLPRLHSTPPRGATERCQRRRRSDPTSVTRQSRVSTSGTDQSR